MCATWRTTGGRKTKISKTTCSLQLSSEGHCETGGHEADRGGLDVLMLHTIKVASVKGNRFCPDAERASTKSGKARTLKVRESAGYWACCMR
jgi:hypothetical protein